MQTKQIPLHDFQVLPTIYATDLTPIEPSRLPKFEDIYPGKGYGGGYMVTNEDPGTIQKLISGKHFRRFGGIAGGGDQLLQSFLPVSREAVVVDHCYKSLWGLWVKILLLDALGADGFLQLLWSDAIQFTKAVNQVAPHVPANVKGQVTDSWGILYTPDLNLPNLQPYWTNVDPLKLRESVRKLHRVTVLHGDLTDLASRGPFDLFYLSNALEHFDRLSRYPDPTMVLKPVVRGGTVVLTIPPGNKDRLYGLPFTQIHNLKNSSYNDSAWDYRNYRKEV